MTFYDNLDKSNLKEYFKKLGNICLKHLMLSSDSYVRMIELNTLIKLKVVQMNIKNIYQKI